MAANKLLRTAGFMAAATMLAKICGMIRDMLIGAFFSTGIDAVAYMTASKLPTMMFDIVIGGVISATFIPVFNSVMEKKSKEAAMEFASKFITVIFIITTLISLAGIIFSHQLIYFIAPEFDGLTHNLAAKLSGIMFPMIIFTGLAFSFVGILQSFGEFNIPAIISLVSNLAIILYFAVLGKRFGVMGLSVTMLFAWSLQMIIQLPSLKKLGFKYRPTLKLWDENIKSALVLAGPMLISTWVQPLYSIVNSRLASGIDGGSAVAVLEYANRLYVIVVGVFSFVVTNLIFPRMSRANAAEDKNGAKELISTSLRAISIVILPIMAGFIILAKPITSILYEHGVFSPEDIASTSNALLCYSCGMIFLAYNEILSKAFFSMQDAKTPMITALGSMAANIFLAYILSAKFGSGGLALAAAGGSMVNALLNFICMNKKCGKIFDKKDIASIIKTFISALIMAAAVYICLKIMTQQTAGMTCAPWMKNAVISAVCVPAGIIVYAVCCIVTGVDDVKNLLRKH